MRPDLMVAGDARLAMDAELTRVLERGMPGVDKRTVLPNIRIVRLCRICDTNGP